MRIWGKFWKFYDGFLILSNDKFLNEFEGYLLFYIGYIIWYLVISFYYLVYSRFGLFMCINLL